MSSRDGFEEFVTTHERRLRQALTAAFGIDHGRDAAADALAYAWEHWDRVAEMANPAGYLFVVGRDRQRRRLRDRRSKPVFDVGPERAEPWCEPALLAQLAGLSDRERIAVMLVNAFEWSLRGGRRAVGCVQEHGADPCRTGHGEVAVGVGGDVMTIDEQLREIARHADRHQHAITADEIVRRVSGHEITSLAEQKDGAVPDLYPRAAARPKRGHWFTRVALGAAAAVVLVAAIGVLVRRDDRSVIEPFTPVPAANGWVAQNFGNNIWLVQEGETDRVIDQEGGAEACPAFSPDGNRLMYGRANPYGDEVSEAALEVFTVAPDGRTSPLRTIPLDGADGIPCAIWAPDGRWAALGVGGAVWVLDTETAEVRRLPGYDPRDLEWRPGTDELAITGLSDGSSVGDNTPIDIYSVSTGEVRTIDGVEAAELTWSPDGTTIAYTQTVPGVADMKSGITLIDADGSNPRPLTTDNYVADHGIGVVWSPHGDQIAYQRERVDCTGDACYELSEVVLVAATDGPETPIGTERVIPPIVDNFDPARFPGPFAFQQEPWSANSVTWSPDGSELLYSASTVGLLAVPVDSARPAIVLSPDGLIGINDQYATSPWIPLQPWQPVR